MGQTGSSRGIDHETPENGRRCYYEILSIKQDATVDECVYFASFAFADRARIRKAYHRKALECHPDRNLDDVENKTRLFAELQQAYEVLSDAQDRAWYDAHKDSILGTEPSIGAGETGRKGDNAVTAQDVATFYADVSHHPGRSAPPSKFFSMTRDFFSHVADSEIAAAVSNGKEAASFPSFGPEAGASDQDIKEFYAFWGSFSTTQTFAWRDLFRAQDAADRRTRRMMEKENQRRRDEGVREFNIAIRNLVSYVKRNDPRKPRHYVSDAERNNFLRNLSSAQALQSRMKNKTKVAEGDVPEWATPRWSDESEQSESTDKEVNRIQCLLCKKTFRSQNQLTSHERSKKHTKAAKDLRRQMALDSDLVELTITPSTADPRLADSGNLSEASKPEQRPKSSPVHWQSTAGSTISEQKLKPKASGRNMASNLADDSHRTADTPSATSSPIEDTHRDTEENPLSANSRQQQGQATRNRVRGDERKPRRARGAKTSAATASPSNAPTCVVCHAMFSSKTKLFEHIRKAGHFAPLAEVRGPQKINTGRGG